MELLAGNLIATSISIHGDNWTTVCNTCCQFNCLFTHLYKSNSILTSIAFLFNCLFTHLSKSYRILTSITFHGDNCVHHLFFPPSTLVTEDFLEIIIHHVLGYLGDRHTNTPGTLVKLYSKYLGDHYT